MRPFTLLIQRSRGLYFLNSRVEEGESLERWGNPNSTTLDPIHLVVSLKGPSFQIATGENLVQLIQNEGSACAF